MNSASTASPAWVRAAAIALLAAAVSLLRFTPPFVLWRGLAIPAAASDPALNRAGDALGQLGHPLAYAASANNRVIEWRLFFPLLGHGLALPPRLYLALPHLGCLLVLAYVAWLLLRGGGRPGAACAGAVLAATCSWFFVSTAWLAYFDSWYVLGLLLAVFGSPAAVLAAVLVAPWIDERFVLTLPLCLLLRDRFLAASGPPRSVRDRIREALGCAAALLPWVLVRVGAYAAHRDTVSGDYLQAMTPWANRPYYLLGLWEGLRWAWVPLLAGLALEWRANWRTGAVLGAALGLTLAVNLAIANDLSRSVSTALPAVVLGLLVLQLRLPRWQWWILVPAAALNLVFPAEHVVSSWTEAISPLPVELEHARHPPAVLDPAYYTAAAAALNDRNDPAGALPLLAEALALDPRDAIAYSNRAVSDYKLGRLSAALADADRAVALRPGFVEALFNRGIIRAAGGDRRGAREDVEAALRLAPADWPGRQPAEARLAAWAGAE